MDLPSNLLRSTLLATIIFWCVLFDKETALSAIPFITISVVPIFFCCFAVITLTVYPFFFFREKLKPKTEVFKTIFPYYSIVGFIICLTGILASGYSLFATAFFTSAFITTSQSWVWFAKHKPV